MFINESPTDEKICEVHGLSVLERALVLAYLQGCVYSWCKNHSSYSASGVLESEPFKAQFFLGGENYHWQGTPMYCLYAKRCREYGGNSEKASSQAARDVGHLLKRLLRNDKRGFYTWLDSREYRWYQWDGSPDAEIVESSPLYSEYIIEARNHLELAEDSFIE